MWHVVVDAQPLLRVGRGLWAVSPRPCGPVCSVTACSALSPARDRATPRAACACCLHRVPPGLLPSGLCLTGSVGVSGFWRLRLRLFDCIAEARGRCAPLSSLSRERERERPAACWLAATSCCAEISAVARARQRNPGAPASQTRVAAYEGPPEGWGRSMDPPKVRLTLLGGARAL